MCIGWWENSHWTNIILGFFQGAFKGLGKTCNLGYTVKLLDSCLYTTKENLGKGTNNVGKFKALIFIMKSTLNKGI